MFSKSKKNRKTNNFLRKMISTSKVIKHWSNIFYFSNCFFFEKKTSFSANKSVSIWKIAYELTLRSETDKIEIQLEILK